MQRAGKLPTMPGSVAQFMDGGGKLDIVYEGPLARAARLSETVAVQRFIQTIGPLAQFQPDVLDNIEMDEVVRFSARNLDVPAQLVRDPAKVKQIRAEKAKLDEQKRQEETMQAQAQAAGGSGGAAGAIDALTKASQAGILPQSGAVTGKTARGPAPVANG